MSSPSWHSAIAQDTWGALPNSNLNSSGVMAAAGAHWVIDAWGGAIIVTGGLYLGATFTPGTFMVIWGGGHTNYSGNELYAYGPFENDSPTWNILRNPTSPAPTDVETDGSGNPPSRHTYSGFVYVNDGTRNRLFAMGTLFSYIASNGYAHVLSYNFNQASPNSNQPWALHVALDAAANIAVWEQSSNKIWFHQQSTSHIGCYDVAANTYVRNIYTTSLGLEANAAAALDTSRGIIFFWDGTGGLSAYRTNNGVANDYYAPTTTGTAPTTGYGSIVHDAANDCFWVWRGNGKEIWKLTPPATNPYQGGNAWTWSHATPGTGSTPDAQNNLGDATLATGQATFGRFNRIEKADIVGNVLLNNYDNNIYFYKSGPSVLPPASDLGPRRLYRQLLAQPA